MIVGGNSINIIGSKPFIADVDASKVIEYIRATGVVITKPMRDYAHYLITNMKNIGTWQSSLAVYGCLGSTANSHAINWKDLRNLDAAYRLTYFGGGGVTHGVNGITFSGANGVYAETFLSPNILPQNTNFLGLYYNSLTSANRVEGNAVIGSTNGGTGSSLKIEVTNFYNATATANNNSDANRVFGGAPTSKDFLLTVRENSNNTFLVRSNSRIVTKNNSTSIAPSLFTLSIGAVKFGSLSSETNLGTGFTTPLVIIGNTALTQSQATQQLQIATNAQTILNRA